MVNENYTMLLAKFGQKLGLGHDLERRTRRPLADCELTVAV